MADFGIDRLESLVRDEMAARAAESSPESYGERLRAMSRRPGKSGSASRRAMGRLERAARRVLHEIRKRRSR